MKTLLIATALAVTALPSQAIDLGKLGSAIKSQTQPQTEGGLMDSLVSTLGVSQDQAQGGTGALLAMAKDNMSGNDFGKLAELFPSLDQLLAAAPDLGENAAQSTGSQGGLLGKAGALLGGDGGDGNPSLDALGSAFESLGMEPGMVQQFLPPLLNYVQSEGGTALMQSLKTALMGA